MSVAVLGAGGALRAWDPTAQQFSEPDTLYLQDMATEAALSAWEGGMVGATEYTGATVDKPPWQGGSAATVVPGKYRDGLRANGATLLLGMSGAWSTDQWTYEFFVSSDIAWASLSNAVAIAYWMDYAQIIHTTLNASTIRAGFSHQQNAAAIINKTAVTSVQAFAAATFVSVAVTMLAGTMKVYANGVLVATETGCNAPRMNGDNWNAAYGGLTLSADTHLTVSDFRLSRLARVPGQTPVAP